MKRRGLGGLFADGGAMGAEKMSKKCHGLTVMMRLHGPEQARQYKAQQGEHDVTDPLAATL